MDFNGFLNLNKPPDFTSHDCVAKLRGILKTKKIGHGGTLDPLATGVLPIAIGKATRLLQFLPTTKAYKAIIRLGMTTDTDDLAGKVIEEKPTDNLTLEKITPYLKDFQGKIEQIPPAYSAIKKDGKKLYELARKGKFIDEIPSREVEIFELETVDWCVKQYPELTVNIVCSAGTYIRAIARDLGEKLGCGGTLANLVRTYSCGMDLSDSLSLEDIIRGKEEETLSLISLDRPLSNLPLIELNQEESLRWCQGQKLAIQWQKKDTYCRVYNPENKFLGISEVREDKEINQQQILKPKVVISI